MNDNFPPSQIDWTGQSSLERKRRKRLLLAIIAIGIVFVVITVLIYILLASNSAGRAFTTGITNPRHSAFLRHPQKEPEKAIPLGESDRPEPDNSATTEYFDGIRS